MNTKGFGYSVVGGRDINQDTFLVNDEKCLYAVADGVGGGMKGEVAAQMATDGLNQLFVDPTQNLTDIVGQLQDNVYNEAMSTLGEPVMGTTLTGGVFHDGHLHFCHVGDSRLYHFTSGVLKQLTEDQEYYDDSIRATVLSSYLGIPSDTHPLRIAEDKVPLTTGDVILFCTDGLYRQMTEPRMAQLIKQFAGQPEVLVQTLCEEASKKNYSDNVTVVVVEIP